MLKLINVKILKYKSFETTSTVMINPKITTLVGVNESGKTAFLEAMAKTNYFDKNDTKFEFDTDYDYPRKEKKKMEREKIDPEAIQLTYKISDDLLDQIFKDVGNKMDKIIKISTRYSGFRTIHHDSNITQSIKTKFFRKRGFAQQSIDMLKKISNKVEFTEFVNNIEDPSLREKFNGLSKYFQNEKWSNPLEYYVYMKYIDPNFPHFMYYDEYYSLPSRINLNLLEQNPNRSDGYKTAKALIDLAGIDLSNIRQHSDYERAKAELEATSAEITTELFEYWKTNKNLRIHFDIDRVQENNQIIPHLEIRIENTRYMMTLPLKNRSKGFNWFFSFLVWFSKIQYDEDKSYILLLDEPGINLHAKAQENLLMFIESLSNKYQVIYTTHSPFMIDSSHLDRVRTLSETDNGSIISESIQEKDPNTLFPLQAALGYDIAQNLYITKDNLLVEGPTDYILIKAMSEIFLKENLEGLNDKFTIVPVGGLDKVSTFISLLRGSDLNVVCLLDTFKDPKGQVKFNNLLQLKIIKQKNVHFFNDFVDSQEISEIEDLFLPSDYLKLYNIANPENQIKMDDLDPNNTKPIVQRIQKLLGQRYNHYKVAKTLLERDVDTSFFRKTTQNRFSNVFSQINKLV